MLLERALPRKHHRQSDAVGIGLESVYYLRVQVKTTTATHRLRIRCPFGATKVILKILRYYYLQLLSTKIQESEKGPIETKNKQAFDLLLYCKTITLTF